MRICGQWFSTELMHDLQTAVVRDPTISRSALARKVCERLDWKRPTGQFQEAGARKALLLLHRKGALRLPEARPSPPRPTHRPLPAVLSPLEADLSALGPIELVQVTDALTPTYRSLMAHHPLGDKPLCGAQLRYLIRCEAGWLGACAFQSAHFALADRDQFIGWNETARRANLGRAVNHARFLILPSAKVKNLASHVLGKLAQCVPDDWQARYGVRPVLMETFVHPDYGGTCYRAANWLEVGTSAGRRDGVKKRLLLYPLSPDWQAQLRHTQAVAPSQRPAQFAHWAEEEFGALHVWDERLKRRLYHLADDAFNRSEGSLPERAQSYAETMATTRFMKNPKINMQLILAAHREAAVGRCLKHPVVLVPQDTTYLNYSAQQATEGLGPIGPKADGPQGLVLHNAHAFTPTGTPLGVLDASCWARDPGQHGQVRAPDERESLKWIDAYRSLSEIQRAHPETMFVSVCGREGDFFDLLALAAQPGGARLLVRAEASRHMKVSTGSTEAPESLWDLMGRQPCAGVKKQALPRQGSRRAREAHLEVRFSPVTLHPPVSRKSAAPVTCWAVYLNEVGTVPQEEKPVEWMLLATVPTTSLEEACTRADWYAVRWGIEVFHRTLKSGCNIESRQLGAASRIENCLAIDLVVAWRITCLAHYLPLQAEPGYARCALHGLLLGSGMEILVRGGVRQDRSTAHHSAAGPCRWLAGQIGRPSGAQVRWRTRRGNALARLAETRFRRAGVAAPLPSCPGTSRLAGIPG